MFREGPRRATLADVFAREDRERAQKTLRDAHGRMSATVFKTGVDMDSFGASPGNTVEADKRTVEECKKRFASDEQRLSPRERAEHREAKFAADVFEGVVYDEVNESGWLGEGVVAVRTTPYDDIVNGVDIVIEMTDPSGGRRHLALAVDVSFGEWAVPNKFRRILEEIDRGEAAKIKYYESAGTKETLRNVPRTVVGVERGVVEELADLWLEKETHRVKKEKLRTHPIQHMILKQVVEQLEVYEAYALRGEHPTQGQRNVAAFCQKARLVLQKMLEEKSSLPLGMFRGDRVCEQIDRSLKMTKARIARSASEGKESQE